MAIYEERIKTIIERALKNAGEQVDLSAGRLILTDYTDIDHPVYYQIKLERRS